MTPRRLLLALLLALVTVPATPALAGTPTKPAGPTKGAAITKTEGPTKIERKVVRLLNQIRADHGLPKLRVAVSLTRAARHHSRDMVKRRYFAHPSKSGESFATRVRRFHRSSTVGENIAWGTGSYATAAGIVAMWMRSPGHRAIILDRDFRLVGVGRATGTFRGYRGAAVYTADFAAH